MADAGEPDWVRYARKVLRWYPEHTVWALAEIHAWERAIALSRKRGGFHAGQDGHAA